MAAAITKARASDASGARIDIPAPRRVSITWSSPFCVGSDDVES